MKEETEREIPGNSTGTTGLEIAVIGMAGKFPGAGNTREFWESIKNGVETTWFFSGRELSGAGIEAQAYDNPRYVKAYGVLEGIEYFDSSFFGYNTREADVMDPQVRVFHEVAWGALEDAGYCPDDYEGLIGLYAGASSNMSWGMQVQLSGKAEELGGFAAYQLLDKDFMCMLISYRLNLKGPAVAVQTACSTSLTAIHLASQAILNGECDMALAGGVTVRGLGKAGYLYQEGMIYSPDGHCRPFDAAARGTFAGDGAAIVVLKRLENALAAGDHIYAVVKGSAINNDGIRKVAFTAPSIEGQAEAIITAQEMAETPPETITYVETHGTGTELGDPVEIEALKLAFNTDRKGYCAIGTLKSNMGHLDNAAGAAGFIKTVLSLYHGLIPPSLHYNTPNPKIDFQNSPFYVNTRLKAWETGEWPRRAGVSSFGIGGTNAHVVLEERPGGHSSNEEGSKEEGGRQYQLILLSAKSEDALERLTRNLETHFKENPGLNPDDAAYTLQVGRKAFKYRRVLVAATAAEAVEILSNPGSEKIYTYIKKDEDKDLPVIFMYPGQGAQYVNMGLGLYQTEPVFRAEMDRCFEILEPLLDQDIKGVLYSLYRSNRSYRSYIPIDQTEIAQPMLFAVEYSLAQVLLKWGIKPYAMIGHSIGEYVAACLAGVFTREDALALVAERGRLMQGMPGGSMLTVPLPEKELTPLLKSWDEISLAAVNSTNHCVVSGPHESIEALSRQLKEKGIESRALQTSHAFHSKMMDPILAQFEARVGKVRLAAKADIPYISNVTGTWANIKEAATARYWARHLRETVRFHEGITELLKNPGAIFVEVGPGRSLSTFVRQHQNRQPGPPVIELMRHPKTGEPDTYYLVKQIGHLWGNGKRIDWEEFRAGEKRRRISLPTYPFKGERYRLGNPALVIDKDRLTASYRQQTQPAPQATKTGKIADIAQWFYVPTWKPTPIDGVQEAAEALGPGENYLVLVEEGELGPRLVKRLKQRTRQVIVVKQGPGFTRPAGEEDEYIINPRQEDDYRALFKELAAAGKLPRKIIHCWSVTEPGNKSGREVLGIEGVEPAADLGFYSLLNLARAIGQLGSGADEPGGNRKEIVVLTDGVQAVTGKEAIEPLKALVRGAIQVIPVEYPGLSCRGIDIDNPLTAPGSKTEDRDAVEGLEQQEQLEQVVNLLDTEIALKNSHEPAVYTAYRENRRWVQVYEPASLEMKEQAPSVLKEKGVYMITGGLGGIGLVLAENLAKKFKARLILTGRTPFPAREEWESRHSSPGPTDETAVKIKKILEWEAAGAEVLICRADVSNLQQMQDVARQAREHFGTIDGIIHAAGLPDGGLIPIRTREMSETVLAPKVQGTLVLDRLFCRGQENPLEFMVLCSSIAAVLSPVGQAAYCAANAFLDAYAKYNTTVNHIYTVAIDWDAWQEVGMAVRAVEKLAAANPNPPQGEILMGEISLGKIGEEEIHPLKIKHPLFEGSSNGHPGQKLFVSRLRPDRHWILDEHRIQEKALVPGTAFLEIARAALENLEYAENLENLAAPGILELQDVFFLTPLIVKDDEEKEVQTLVNKTGEEYTFSVASRAKPGEDRWIEHAKGKARLVPRQEPEKYEIAGLEAQCRHREMTFNPEAWTGWLDKEESRTQGSMFFGPRWNSLRRAQAGENLAFTYLELPEVFTPDLEVYKLHPALLDMATISARMFHTHDGYYLPFGYRKVTLKKNLPAKIFCYARSTQKDPAQQELLTFDVTLLDEQGIERVVIEGYTLKRLNQPPRENLENDQAGMVETLGEAGSDFRENALKDGILPGEGVEVFRRVLAAKKWSQVVVSTTDLLPRMKESRSISGVLRSEGLLGGMDAVPMKPRPGMNTPYAAPGSETERRLALIWQRFLGIAPVGIHDDFFELGGDSLKVMTISAKIHRELDLEIPLAEFFNRPTIKKLAEYVNSVGNGTRGTYAAINLVEAKEYYPLSTGQKRLYMLQRMDPGSLAYHLPFVYRLEGEVDEEKLERVFTQIIARQESFRTSFMVVEGEPVQVLDKKFLEVQEFFISKVMDDRCGWKSDCDSQQTLIGSPRRGAWPPEAAIRPFDLGQAPLFRVSLIKTAPNEHILVLDLHHIIADGTSIGILIKEFMALYAGKELPGLSTRYIDYAQWQSRQWNKENPVYRRQETFWMNEIPGEIPVLNLPTDFPRPAVRRYDGDAYSFALDSGETQALEKMAAEEEVSLYTVLLALLNVFLSKITHQEDILVGTQVAGRRHPDLQEIIGVFINTLVLRNYPQREKTFKEFLKETKTRALSAFENQEYPFEDLVEKRLGKRNLDRNPFFDVMFVWQNWEAAEVRIPGLTLKSYEKELKREALLDLSIYGYDAEEQLKFSLEYSTVLFKKETVARFVDYWKEIISIVSVNKGIQLKDIRISHDLGAAESGVLQEEDKEFGF